MYDYDMDEFYSENSCERPTDLNEGKEFWTLLWGGEFSGIHAVNPTNHGHDHVPIVEYPERLRGEYLYQPHPEEVDDFDQNADKWINRELELTPVYLRVVKNNRMNSVVKAKIPPENEWPDLNPEEEDFFETPNRDGETSEWEGSSQNIDQSKQQNRREVFKEGDIRGSRNDLIKNNK